MNHSLPFVPPSDPIADFYRQASLALLAQLFSGISASSIPDDMRTRLHNLFHMHINPWECYYALQAISCCPQDFKISHLLALHQKADAQSNLIDILLVEWRPSTPNVNMGLGILFITRSTVFKRLNFTECIHILYQMWACPEPVIFAQAYLRIPYPSVLFERFISCVTVFKNITRPRGIDVEIVFQIIQEGLGQPVPQNQAFLNEITALNINESPFSAFENILDTVPMGDIPASVAIYLSSGPVIPNGNNTDNASSDAGSDGIKSATSSPMTIGDSVSSSLASSARSSPLRFTSDSSANQASPSPGNAPGID
jgi:hypothetical protein